LVLLIYYGYMIYTHSITSKGQITIPKEFRELLGLDKLGKASIGLNSKNQIVITTPKNLADIRASLSKPSFKDDLSEKEQVISTLLVKKYVVR
jgi:bifunctional DNA-binding transcriptional regulator/antitoxin component of YhaV-PrlF toxin-antitoxin module